MEDKYGDAVRTVGQWIARETQVRKYKREEVKALSEALMLLKAYFDKTEVPDAD